jgi:hypothetical protein
MYLLNWLTSPPPPVGGGGKQHVDISATTTVALPTKRDHLSEHLHWRDQEGAFTHIGTLPLPGLPPL